MGPSNTILIATIAAALVALTVIYAVLYRKAPRGIALVRTGLGGRKVIIDGGCLTLPVFQEMRKVKLSTVQLTVRRRGDDALITHDSLRVDTTVDFYVSVREDHDSVAQAARTLDERTFEADGLRELIEGKLVDALRAVAATQTMMSLHENRQEFVQQVQEIVSNDLAKNGLQLEAVSLTGLDQTPTENLDANNMFNATALKVTAERVAEQTEARSEAEANAKIAESREQARAEEESVKAKERVERSNIEKERSVNVYQSDSEAESRKAAINADKEAEQAEIEKEEDVKNRKIERDQRLQIAEQEQRIAVAEKSKSESQAQSEAEEARQQAVVAEEQVQTAREEAIAERARKIAVIKAKEEAEQEATQVRIAAEARRDAAEYDKQAMELTAEGDQAEKQAHAAGNQAINQAKNQLDQRLMDFEERLKELDVAPEVVKELVAPFEGVGNNMKSVFVHGLGGNGGSGDGQGSPLNSGSGNSRSVIEDLFQQIMGYSVSQPALKRIGESVGVDLEETLRSGQMARPASNESGETAADADHQGSLAQEDTSDHQESAAPNDEQEAGATEPNVEQPSQAPSETDASEEADVSGPNS